jgi:hypothetical protein
VAIAALLVLVPAVGASQDVMTIGSSEEPLSPGELLVVPIIVRDTSGTSLDVDAGANRKIQDLSISNLQVDDCKKDLDLAQQELDLAELLLDLLQ